jgi:hypothetical protein
MICAVRYHNGALVIISDLDLGPPSTRLVKQFIITYIYICMYMYYVHYIYFIRVRVNN